MTSAVNPSSTSTLDIARTFLTPLCKDVHVLDLRELMRLTHTAYLFSRSDLQLLSSQWEEILPVSKLRRNVIRLVSG